MSALGRLAPIRPVTIRDLAQDALLRRWLLLIASCAGWGIGLAATIQLVLIDGGMAYDAYAYWMAGRNVLAGEALYSSTAVDALGAYKYPPLFAQLWAPLSLLPALAFSWLWRVGCLLCVRWLAGSWRNVGLWLLVPFTITELSLANVTFPVAMMTVMALRGRPWLAPWAAALKFGPALALPYVWLTDPPRRHSIVVGSILLAGACAVSVGLDPAAWVMYVDSMRSSTDASMSGAGVIALAPTGALDLALRVGLAVGMAALAVRLRSDRLLFTATVIAVPILAVWRFAPLLVLPRLGRSK